MKRTLALVAFLFTLAVPVAALAQEAATATAGNVVQDAGAVIDAVRTGSAIGIAATVIMLLINLFKAPWLGGLVNKIPKRWRVAIPILLGGVAGILTNIGGGLSWPEALMVGLFSGPTAVFAHEAVVEAILGKAVSRGPSGPDVVG